MSQDIKLGKQSFSERETLNEKNDCTVRALSEALEIGYLEAYGMMIGAGRKKGRGVHAQDFYKLICMTHLDRPNMTVENFVRYYVNFGNWIIQIRGHVFAVISGEIRDIGYVQGNLKRHVIQAWRMK